MVHTVALLAPNGNVGSATLRHLLLAQKNGQMKLIILHRPGGPPKQLPSDSGVEVREIDLEGPLDKIGKAVHGVNVAISALPITAVHLQLNFVQALSKTPGFVTFFPARYSIPLTDDDYPHLPFMQPFLDTEKLAAELNVAVTQLWTGAFISSFQFGWLGTSLDENKITANTNQLSNWTPITTLGHLGTTLADLSARDPTSIAGKSFSAVTFRPSGQDLQNAFTELNSNTPATVVTQTSDDLEKLLQDTQGLGAFIGVYMRHWDQGDLEFPAMIPAANKTSLVAELRKIYGLD